MKRTWTIGGPADMALAWVARRPVGLL